MHVALLIVDTFAVIGGGCIAATLLGLEDPLDWWLASGLLAVAEVLLVSLAAGVVLHSFAPGTVTALTLATSAALGVVALGRRARPPAGLAVVYRLGELAWWQTVLAASAAAALAWRVVPAVGLPPFAYDALTYHLTAVATWIQSGRIAVNPYAPCCGHYPSNAEVLFAWPTLLLHSDVLTQTVQVGMALLAALAVAGLARVVGATGLLAATAAFLFALTPIVLTQANVNYNDLTVATFLLASLYYCARFFAGGRRPHLFLAGVSLGLLLGTKVDALAMVVILLAVLLVQLVRRRALVGVPTLGVPLLLLGGWWYARNWAQEGNPLWPVRVDGIFAGPRSAHSYLTPPPGGSRNVVVEVARSWYHDLVFWMRRDYSYEQRDGGLGPLWSWVGWWAALLLAVVALRSRRDFAAAVLVPVAVIFAVEPYRWWSRFTIYLAAVGAIGIVVLLQRLQGRLALALETIVVLLALAGAARATWSLAPASRAADIDMVRVARVALHPSRSHTVGDLFFPEYRWLDRVPRDASIGVETNAPSIRFVYPLFGPHLDRRVVQLLGRGPAALDPGLRRAPPTFLFVEARGAFARWAATRPRYSLIYRGRGVAVYRRGTAR